MTPMWGRWREQDPIICKFVYVWEQITTKIRCQNKAFQFNLSNNFFVEFMALNCSDIRCYPHLFLGHLESGKTHRCCSQSLPSPGPPPPWSIGSSKWCHFPSHLYVNNGARKRNHHWAFTKSKLLQLLLSWPYHLKQMYLHKTLPYSNNNIPASVKPSTHISDRN